MQFSYLFTIGFAALAVSSPAPAPTADGSAKPSPSPIRLSNIISVVQTPAKVAREGQILTNFINKVKQNEPGVLEFQLNLDKNTSQYLTYEIYKNQEAINVHLNSSYLAHLLYLENKEGLKRAPNMVYFLDELVTQFIRN